MFVANNLEPYFEILAEKSWVLIELKPEIVQKLFESLIQQKDFFKQGTTPLAANISTEKYRQDQILWLDPEKPFNEVEVFFHSQLEHLRLHIKDYFRMALQSYECHYAYYNTGNTYVKHRDTTSHNNQRIFSFVLYLNSEWKESDGGQLIGYNQQEEAIFNVLPIAGRMIIFKSDLLHEVTASQKTRYSLTGWFRK